MEKETFLRKCGGLISSFLPHLLMAFSWMLLTFFVINIFNPAMSFLDSKLSQQFEVLYAAVTIICAVIAVIQKRMRIFSIIAAVVVIAFVIPTIIALVKHSITPLDNSYFRTMACVTSLVNLVYSITEIVVMRRQAKMES